MLKSFIFSSIVGALLGALLYVYINEVVALSIVLGFVVYFTVQKILQLQGKKQSVSKLPKVVAGLVSGFFQGGGFSGGSVREGYLYAKGLTLQEVRATGAAIGAISFILATLVRGLSGQLDYSTLWLLIPLIPVLIAGTFLGRHITIKLSTKWQNIIIVGVLILSIFILIFELVKLLIKA